nr:hypothetical protein Itr_chr14CG03440 [Ipomoea trifida]
MVRLLLWENGGDMEKKTRPCQSQGREREIEAPLAIVTAVARVNIAVKYHTTADRHPSPPLDGADRKKNGGRSSKKAPHHPRRAAVAKTQIGGKTIGSFGQKQ